MSIAGTLNYNGKSNIVFSENVKVKYNGRNEYVENNNNVNIQVDEKRKAIFDRLRTYMAKDNNPQDLSYTDLSYAKELEGSLGINKIRRDAKAGVVTFICDDGVNFQFDFETKAEIVKEPVAPEKPEKDKVITHVLDAFDTLSALAQKYHCTVKEIQELNNIEDPSRVQYQQKVKIPTYSEKTWQTYEAKERKYQKELENFYEYQRTQEIYEKVKHASKEIKKGEAYYPNDYAFEIQTDEKGHETGDVIIRLKDNKTLYDVRTELGLPPGILTYYNPELKEQEMEYIGDTMVKTRDTQKAYEDDIYTFPGNYLNPVEPFIHKVKVFFNNLFN